MKYTIKDIVENDLCIGCGVCISESESSKMVWNEYGFLVPDISKVFKEDAVKVCPYNPEPEKEIEDEDKIAEFFLPNTPFKDPQIGHYHEIYVGHAQEFRASSSSGGIGTYVLEQLLKQKIVDHLFVVKEKDGEYSYQWFDSVEDIKNTSKTRYLPVSLEKLFLEIDSKPGKVAVTGIPPFLKAIRLKQYYYPEYREKIPFLVGIICGGWKSKFFTDYLAQKAGIRGNYSKQEYRIKDEASYALDYSFGAFDENNNFYQMKMKLAGNMWGTGLFNANASDFSDDVTAELGDISLGDAWIPPYNKDGRGTSLFVTRSAIADKLIQEGIQKGELSLETLPLKDFINSQIGAFRHRHIGLKYRVDELKKSNGIILFKRKRNLVNAPFEYQWVQKQRRKVRRASLETWLKHKKVEEFELKIQPMKEKLRKATLFYHRVQKLKRMFKMKTL